MWSLYYCFVNPIINQNYIPKVWWTWKTCFLIQGKKIKNWYWKNKEKVLLWSSQMWRSYTRYTFSIKVNGIQPTMSQMAVIKTQLTWSLLTLSCFSFQSHFISFQKLKRVLIDSCVINWNESWRQTFCFEIWDSVRNKKITIFISNKKDLD